MKRSLLLYVILTSISWAQFEAGTISAGSLFSYSSTSSGGDVVTNSHAGEGGFNIFTFTVKPSLGYFVINNLALELIFSRTAYGTDDNDLSYTIFGPGGSYHAGHLYGGGAYVFMNGESSGGSHVSTSKMNFIEVHGGYLQKLVEHVFLDLNASYLTGIGDEVSNNGGEDYTRKNDMTMLTISAGIKAYFKFR